MILAAQRTIFGVDLNLAQILGKPYLLKPNTTLNEKFGVLSGTQVPTGVYPTLNYIALGVGGEGVIDNGNGFPYSKHTAMDGALFKHIPFLVRDIDRDLSPTERAQYRMRRVENIRGTDYICYYLKRIQNVDYKDVFFHIASNNGTNILNIFDTNDSRILNPTPLNKLVDNTSIMSSEYIAKTAKVEFVINDADLKNLKEVFELFNIETNQVTEIGLCSGIDMATDYGTEAIAAQIMYHVDVTIDMTMQLNSGGRFSRTIEIGGLESLLTQSIYGV